MPSPNSCALCFVHRQTRPLTPRFSFLYHPYPTARRPLNMMLSGTGYQAEVTPSLSRCQRASSSPRTVSNIPHVRFGLQAHFLALLTPCLCSIRM